MTRDDDTRWDHIIEILLAAGEGDDLGGDVTDVDGDDDATRRPE